jgi:hypothetical protein
LVDRQVVLDVVAQFMPLGQDLPSNGGFADGQVPTASTVIGTFAVLGTLGSCGFGSGSLWQWEVNVIGAGRAAGASALSAPRSTAVPVAADVAGRGCGDGRRFGLGRPDRCRTSRGVGIRRYWGAMARATGRAARDARSSI